MTSNATGTIIDGDSDLYSVCFEHCLNEQGWRRIAESNQQICPVSSY